MGTTTKIAWADHTFSPWRGCSHVSAGCDNCYAERQAKRNPAVLGEWGPEGKRVVAAEKYWRLPELWNRQAGRRNAAWSDHVAELDMPAPPLGPHRPRVFCGSLMDMFEERDDLADIRRRVFRLIDQTPHLDWLLVTKRPENVRRMWRPTPGVSPHSPASTIEEALEVAYRDNVWLITSVEDQAAADRRITALLNCRELVPVLGLSIEPLLAPVDLASAVPSEDGFVATSEGPWHVGDGAPYVDWVIVGGESGPNARPCNVAWIRDIVRQCKEANVPCFVKQLGAYCVGPLEAARENDTCRWMLKHAAGADPVEWPEDLRVQEFPR